LVSQLSGLPAIPDQAGNDWLRLVASDLQRPRP
jgi:hypothetical protein